MYFPYLRGRQYEMIALKELAQKGLISKLILPVVEPIKITTTFNSAISAYIDSNLNIAIINNPEVGPLKKEIVTQLIPFKEKNIVAASIMQENIDVSIETLSKEGVQKEDLLVVINSRDYLDNYKKTFKEVSPKYTLLPDERSIRRAISSGKILFGDKFKRKEKNSDYADPDDEFFSDDHLFYIKEGYIGFGDYSIIGDTYDEGGFAPKAVAIHVVYFDEEKQLRVHHFVSNSNSGIEDPAGKFYEAVTKLFKWYRECLDESQQTYALNILLEYYERGYYPGLPTIKKLSIMHHLELMNKFLNGEIKA